MPLTYDYSDELKRKLRKLSRHDKRRYDIVLKKIAEICAADETSIERYKHLRRGHKGQQRVHIDRSFVLTFHHTKARKHVMFLDFDHHDHAYE